MLIDMHIHTTRYSKSCSILDPGKVLGRLAGLGVDGGMITEHDYSWTDDEIRRLRNNGPGRDLFVASGKEVDCDIGHLLIFGYSGRIAPHTPYRDIIARVRSAGGVVVWAHPLRYGHWDEKGDEDILAVAGHMDGVEALTPSHTPSENERALALAEQHGLTALGGSDAHSTQALGVCLTRFHRPVASLGDLVSAIRDGACQPVIGPAGRAADLLVEAGGSTRV